MKFERTECAMHKIAPWTFPANSGRRQERTERLKKLPDDLFHEALSYLRGSGFRVTKPREVIVRAAISFPGPFHAEDLLARARQNDRLISLATVYRTLPMLLDSRLIRDVELNREHRHIDEPTDVLSFGVDEDGHSAGPRELGDIVICPPRTEDLREAVVHGALHLSGMDHETDEGEMLALQAELLRWVQ